MRKLSLAASVCAFACVVSIASAGGPDQARRAAPESFAFGIGNGMISGHAQRCGRPAWGLRPRGRRRRGGERRKGRRASGRGRNRARLPERRHDREVARLVRRRQEVPARGLAGLEGRVVRRRLQGGAPRQAGPGDRAGHARQGVRRPLSRQRRHDRDRRSTRSSAAGMRELVADLGALVHADGGVSSSLRTATGASRSSASSSDGQLDGWNREDVTWTYDFDKRKYVHNSDRNANEALGRARTGCATTA